ncbi:MAG TPA: A/G-specific adenine glycosylase [Burkholderiales bacterium]
MNSPRYTATFAHDLVAWQRVHGRHDLPWQGTRDPYPIWVSEIMLQQTQVATVMPYYRRFMARFPDVRALAAAPLDDVLAHWSGLGYYSRARHLHAAAVLVCSRHGGVFPRDFDAVQALPGIGRSTAAAIMVFAYGARHAILDGNVKRVLARCRGIRGYPGESAVSAALWQQAETLLPDEDIEAYTQGLMDLGARLCTRRAPRCTACPLQNRCVAYGAGIVQELPTPRPRRAVPRRATTMLVLQHRSEVLLEKRPAPGIWGGLWCFPEIAPGEDAVSASAARFGLDASTVGSMKPLEHGFTHFLLTITPQLLRVSHATPRTEEPGRQWWSLQAARDAGLPAPVRRILDQLSE